MAAACVEFLYGPLAENPHRVGARLRKPFEGHWRARRGEYHVRYMIDDASGSVVVLDISHRRDVYPLRSATRAPRYVREQFGAVDADVEAPRTSSCHLGPLSLKVYRNGVLFANISALLEALNFHHTCVGTAPTAWSTNWDAAQTYNCG